MRSYKQPIIFLSISLVSIVLPKLVDFDISWIGPLLEVFSTGAALISGLLTLMIFYKNKKAKSIVADAASRDILWVKSHLEINARDVFYRVQHSWDDAKTENLQNFVTHRFLSYFQHELENHYERQQPLDISFMDVNETNIIGCEDYSDNYKDKYSVFINGRIKCHYHSQHRPAEEKQFSEMYHFVRVNNQWLLDKITGSPTLIDLLAQRVFAGS